MTDLTIEELQGLTATAERVAEFTKGTPSDLVWLKSAQALALLAMARELVRIRQDGWVSTKERPLEVGEERLMAMQILQNGEPRWYMFVATPDDDDEWTQDGEEPGWPPSEVEFSRPLTPPTTPKAEG